MVTPGRLTDFRRTRSSVYRPLKSCSEHSDENGAERKQRSNRALQSATGDGNPLACYRLYPHDLASEKGCTLLMVKLLSISIDAAQRPVDIGSETQQRAVADQDLIGTVSQEATRTVVHDASRAEPPVDMACDSLNQTLFEVERPARLLSTLSIETAIRLRWALRDIKGNRTKLSPVSSEDLKTLIDMGLVKMCDDVPVVTANGCTEIE